MLDANARYAGFWIRFVARFVDNIIVTIAIMIFASVGGLLPGILHVSDSHVKAGMTVVWVAVVTAYYVLFNSSKKMGTPGKQIVPIIIVDENGNRISRARALGRFFAQFISLLVLFIGFIMIAFHPKKRGLHDLICKTYVIYKPYPAVTGS